MTKEFLAELGSCGGYTRKFRELFPIEQFPAGVEINEDVCAQHADSFDWGWAVEQLLSYEGADVYRQVKRELRDDARAFENELNEKLAAWRTEFNQSHTEPDWDTSNAARQVYNDIHREHTAKLTEQRLADNQRMARAFGRVFDTRPELRSARVEQARERAVAALESRTITAYVDLEHRLITNRAELVRLTDLVPQLEAEEAQLRVRYVPAKARHRAAEAALLADRAAEQARLATDAQARADEAKAEAEKLAAEAEAILNLTVTETETAEESVETTTDDTASTANETETNSSSS